MKRITLLFAALLPLLLLSSCSVGFTERSGFLYKGSYLASVSVSIGEGTAVSPAGSGDEDPSPEEIVRGASVPFTPVTAGYIEMIAGEDCSVRMIGVFTSDGVKTRFAEKDLSSLPAGRYVLMMQNTVRKEGREEFILSGIKKS